MKKENQLTKIINWLTPMIKQPVYKKQLQLFFETTTNYRRILCKLRDEYGYDLHHIGGSDAKKHGLIEKYPSGTWMLMSLDMLECNKRGKLSKKQRAFVFERDGNRCVMCGATENLEIDEKVAVYYGGEVTIDNCSVKCSTCNGGKKSYKLDFSGDNLSYKIINNKGEEITIDEIFIIETMYNNTIVSRKMNADLIMIDVLAEEHHKQKKQLI